MNAVAGCTREGAPRATATPLCHLIPDSRCRRRSCMKARRRLFIVWLVMSLGVACGWLALGGLSGMRVQAAANTATNTLYWSSQAYAYLSPTPTPDPFNIAPATEPSWRWTLGLNQQAGRSSQTLSLSWWSADIAQSGRTGIAWAYRVRQPLLIFGFAQYGGHLALQAGESGTPPGLALDAGVDAGAVVGNLAASARLLHRSAQYVDLPATPTADLFPLLPSPTPMAGTLAETEIRTSLSQATWAANIGWRWPTGSAPQVGLALASQLRLGTVGSLAGRLGLKSSQGLAIVVYGGSLNLSPWSGMKTYIDVASDSQTGCRWQGGLELNAQWRQLNSQVRLAVQQPAITDPVDWAVHLATRVGISTLGLDYSPSGGTGLSASFSW